MSIETNIRDREAAEALHRTIGELLADEVPKLPSDRSREMFWRKLADSVAKNVPQKTFAIKTSEGTTHVPSCSEEAKEAESLNNEIQELAPASQWPDAMDAAEKAADIMYGASGGYGANWAQKTIPSEWGASHSTWTSHQGCAAGD